MQDSACGILHVLRPAGRKEGHGRGGGDDDAGEERGRQGEREARQAAGRMDGRLQDLTVRQQDAEAPVGFGLAGVTGPERGIGGGTRLELAAPPGRGGSGEDVGDQLVVGREGNIV